MTQQSKTKIIGLIVIVLLTTAGTAGAVVYNNATTPSEVLSTNDTSTTTTTSTAGTTTTVPSPSTTTNASSSTSAYKDGTYSAKGTFHTPDGSAYIGVTLTLASSKITKVSIDDSGISSRESVQYTERFISGINSIVVGKNIDEVKVSRVSGASLTPVGFNNALTTIKNDAKA